MLRRSSVLACLTTVALLALAPGASAQVQNQEGLVNVAIGDVIVQVPVGVAANVCDVTVAVLAANADAPAACRATADTIASSGRGAGGSPNQRQEGLVNVAIGDVIVQVPVGVAANICDVTVALLAANADLPAACNATADTVASLGRGGG
jgi:hypothetical protein